MKSLRFRRWLCVGVACATAMVAHPAMASEEEPSGPEASREVITAAELDASREPATEVPNDSSEQVTVEEYIEEQAELGHVVDERDLDVATVISGDFVVSTVQPEHTEIIEDVVVSYDPETDEMSAVTSGVDEASPAVQSGPGMGSWPNWADSFSSSVKLVVYMKYDGHDDTYFKMGHATFQTVRRQYQNDGNGAIDTWQVGRYGVAQPESWCCTASKIWASQKLTDAKQGKAREWSWGLTKPHASFTTCQQGATLTLGWVSYTMSNCDDYDVWTGSVAHQRMYLDQGGWSGGGSRAIGYTSGFTMDDGVFPETTWYQFVTFRDGNMASDSGKKCTSTERGPKDKTDTYTCYFPGSGDATKEAS